MSSLKPNNRKSILEILSQISDTYWEDIIELDSESELPKELLRSLLDIIFETGIDQEQQGNILYAQQLYWDGFEMMKNIMKIDAENKEDYEERMMRVVEAIRRLDKNFQKAVAKKELYGCVKLVEGATGCGYFNLFAPFCKETVVTEVAVFEHDLESLLKVRRLLGFLKFLLKSCRKLKFVYINTSSRMCKNAATLIFQMFDNCHKAVKLEYSNPNVNRIVINNGFIFESPVGLDFYEDQYFSYTSLAMDSLPCKAVEMQVYSFPTFRIPLKTSKHSLQNTEPILSAT